LAPAALWACVCTRRPCRLVVRCRSKMFWLVLMSLADKVSLPAGQRLKASKLMESSERERERERWDSDIAVVDIVMNFSRPSVCYKYTLFGKDFLFLKKWTFIQQRDIKVINSDSKNIYNVISQIKKKSWKKWSRFPQKHLAAQLLIFIIIRNWASIQHIWYLKDHVTLKTGVVIMLKIQLWSQE